LSDLEKEYPEFEKQNFHLSKKEVLERFLREMSFRQDWGFYKMKYPYDKDASAYNSKENRFKEEIFERFKKKEDKFKGDYINSFVKY